MSLIAMLKLRSALPLLMLLTAMTADAASTSQSCILPHHPVASEEVAVDAVVKAVNAAQLLRPWRLSIQCVEFISSQNADEPRYSVTLREKHDAQCGGDPNFAPRVFTVNVASNGRMKTDAYDVADGRDQPLRCPQRGASKPGDVAYDFYRWYLVQDRVSHDPIFNERKQMAHYVSRILLRRADMNQWTCDYDYFTQAQGFDPVWINTVAPEQVQVRGNKASVKLTLGLRAIDVRVAKLTVTLKKEDGLWKIMDVHDDYPEHWDIEEKAREQAEAKEKVEASQPVVDKMQDKAP